MNGRLTNHHATHPSLLRIQLVRSSYAVSSQGRLDWRTVGRAEHGGETITGADISIHSAAMQGTGVLE
jgi:hypothetical protein